MPQPDESSEERRRQPPERFRWPCWLLALAITAAFAGALACPCFLSSGPRPLWATLAVHVFLPQLMAADLVRAWAGFDWPSFVLMMAFAYIPSLIEARLVLVVWNALRFFRKDRDDERTH